MTSLSVFNRYHVVLCGLLLVLAGCATQLVPFYDKAIVDGLTAVNVDTMELMAAASGGTSKETFAQREGRYNRIIGNFDALALQASARPMPSNSLPKALEKMAEKRGITGPMQIVPSAIAFDEIAKTITKMRDTDRKQGVTAMEVQAFRGQALIYLDQALTYEAALER
jgi:hypothetical protein